MNVGFIGLGGMGKYIALNILKAGFPLTVCDLRDDPVQELVTLGATAAATPKEAASSAEIILSSLPNDAASDAVALGETGVLSGAKRGSIYIDTSTITPSLIRHIGEQAKTRGVDVIDAPVSGNVRQREAGNLTVMAGGDTAAVARAMPVFEAFGNNIFHVGAIGSGATIKIVNNMTMATNMVSALEAMILGVKAGLTLDKIREVISVSSGGSAVFDMMIDNIQNRGFRPEPGTVSKQALRTVRKDSALALDLARELNVPLFAGAAAAQAWVSAEAKGLGDMEIHALIKVLEETAGVAVQPPEFRDD